MTKKVKTDTRKPRKPRKPTTSAVPVQVYRRPCPVCGCTQRTPKHHCNYIKFEAPRNIVLPDQTQIVAAGVVKAYCNCKSCGQTLVESEYIAAAEV